MTPTVIWDFQKAKKLYDFLTDDGGEAEWLQQLQDENDPYELGKLFCERRKQQHEDHALLCTMLEALRAVVSPKTSKKLIDAHFPRIREWEALGYAAAKREAAQLFKAPKGPHIERRL